MWLWALGGMVLGGVTSLFGKGGIWLCTHAVEETVHKHLADQISFLDGRDSDLVQLVRDIQTEEEGHIRLARNELNPSSVFLHPLTWIVSVSTGAVIWLSTWGDSSRLAYQLKPGETA